MPLLYLLRRRKWETPLGGPLTITPSKIESKFVWGGLVCAGIALRDAYIARASAVPGTLGSAPAATSPEVPAGTVIGP